jgi:site-specific DNA-methyltransferase (adenine-specific)
MKINCKYDKLVDPRELMDHERNNNKHSSEQIQRLGKLIDHHDFRHPIVVSNLSNKIVFGHARKAASIAMGWTEVPVEYQSFKDEQSEYLALTADNEIARWADLDQKEMLDTLGDLGILTDDFDAELLGIEDFTLPDTEIIPMADEDEIPEHVEPKTKLGDLYKLGEHRLLCGDSTSTTDIDKLTGGVKVDMLFTDPPYGMNYSGRGKDTSNKIMNDDMDPTEFYNLMPEVPERYIWGRIENYSHLKVEPRDTIIWAKNNFGMGRGYRGQYECCFYFGSFNGSDSDLWQHKKDFKYVHPTQKPVELCERAITNSKPKTVLDLFGGSGSTLIACANKNVKSFHMELDPHYCDVIVARWEKYTGNKAELLNQNDVVE